MCYVSPFYLDAVRWNCKYTNTRSLPGFIHPLFPQSEISWQTNTQCRQPMYNEDALETVGITKFHLVILYSLFINYWLQILNKINRFLSTRLHSFTWCWIIATFLYIFRPQSSKIFTIFSLFTKVLYVHTTNTW